MKIKHTSIILIGLVCSALSSAASASIITATYTGIVTYGSGYVDLFSTESSTLVGQAVKTVYTYDTTLGNFHSVNSGGSNYNQILGGSQNHNSSPMLSVVLTINGVKVNFNSSVIGEVLAEQDSSYNVFQHSAYSDIVDNGAAATVLSSEITPALSTDVNSTFNWDQSKGGQSDGFLFAYGYTGAAPTNYEVDFSYNVLEVAVVPANGVPEPSSFYLVGAGFVGLVYVRRKAQSGT
jgi:hypothetical protein